MGRVSLNVSLLKLSCNGLDLVLAHSAESCHNTDKLKKTFHLTSHLYAQQEHISEMTLHYKPELLAICILYLTFMIFFLNLSMCFYTC